MDGSDEYTSANSSNQDAYSTLQQLARAGLEGEDKDIGAHLEFPQQGQHTHGQGVPGKSDIGVAESNDDTRLQATYQRPILLNVYHYDRRVINYGDIGNVSTGDDNRRCTTLTSANTEPVNQMEILKPSGKISRKDEEDGDEITPSATLQVRGYDPKTSLESISLYFEIRRKSGGGGVASVKEDKKRGVIYVTFESNEIAERVLKRDHKLEGKELTVTLSRPQVMYKDKMLVMGVPEDVSKDSLVIYLENVTRIDVDIDSVLYGEEGEVLVSFKEDLKDLSAIIDKMKKKPFKQNKRQIELEVSQVTVTTCIRVKNLPSNASEDTLRYYFENKKSGGSEGEVKDIVMNHQDGFAVVEFATPGVASAVAKRKHVICKATVPVNLHFQCLGESGGSADPNPTKLPPSLELDLDLHKLKHVKVTEKVSENLQACFESTPANFRIDVETSKLILSPDFNLESRNVKSLVKTWSKTVKERCITFFEKIEIEKLRVDHDIWSDSEEITGRIHEDGISIFRHDEKKTIVLVGPGSNIQRRKGNLEVELKSLKEQYEREKSRVTEEHCYNSTKLNLLQSEGFIDKMKFNDLQVDVVEPGKLSFTGQSDDIQRAKIELLQRLAKIPSTVSRDFSKEEVELLKCTEVSKYLETKWKQSSNKAGWEIGQGGVIIVYIHQDEYEALLQFLQKSFKKKTMNLDTDNSTFLKSSKLQAAIESISRNHEGKVVITVEASEMRIVITGLKQDVVSAEADVRDFVDRNSICSQQYTCSDDYKLRYLKLHCQKQIEAIEKDTDDFEIEFIWEDKPHSICLQIRSSKLGYQHARQKLDEIIQHIHIFRRELNKTGMKTFLKDRNVLKNVEKGTNCIISLEEGKESDFGIMFTCQTGSGKLHVGVGSILDVGSSVEGVVVEVTSNLSPDSKQARDTMRRVRRSFTSRPEQERPQSATAHMPRPRILLVKADMGVEEADVIVNSSNSTLNLSNGQVSKSLLKNAGPAIQNECREKYPKGIAMGDIAVTKGGDMQSVEEIYHCTLPSRRDPTGKETFRKTMKKLLEKANDANWKTIAIPALGTGNLGYSRNLVAELMYESVAKFKKETSNITINDVLFIVYPGDAQTIAAFEAEHKKYVEAYGGRVPSTQREIDAARRVELDEYRTKQGYASKFGEPVKPPAAVQPKPQRNVNQPVLRPGSSIPPNRKKTHVPIWIYTEEEEHGRKAVDEIYGQLEAMSGDKNIDVETLKDWNQKQLDKVSDLKWKHDVEITTKRSFGRINIHGLRECVSEASMDVSNVIRAVERDIKDQELAETYLKLVQWLFVDITDEGDDKLMPYPPLVNSHLERAFRTGNKKCTFDGYVFDFELMVKYPEDNVEDKIQIIRRDKVEVAKFNQPDTWTGMAADKDVELIQVMNGSGEFNKVSHQFTTAMGSVQAQITRMDRIQSKTLYQQYQAKKQLLAKRTQGKGVEKTLWHGTQSGVTMSISSHGFNRSYCDTRNNAFGEGVYFAVDAGYASRDRYAKADQGNRYMFMCKVLTGEYTVGSTGIRVPPPKDPSKPEIFCDSVVDKVDDPEIFVIFNDSQAYPEYLIKFQ